MMVGRPGNEASNNYTSPILTLTSAFVQKLSKTLCAHAVPSHWLCSSYASATNLSNHQASSLLVKWVVANTTNISLEHAGLFDLSMQSVTILQIIGKGYWVHSRVGNLPPSEKAPSMLLHRTTANEKY